VLKLHAAGCSLGEIVKSLKLTKTTVYRIIHAKESKLCTVCFVNECRSFSQQTAIRLKCDFDP
jgi:plasmid maintenance system antidote protein VapI